MTNQHLDNSLLADPSVIYREDWTLLEKMSIHQEGLIIDRVIEPPGEAEVPPMTHHGLVFYLSHGTRQVTRIDGQEYDGEIHPKEFCLHPATFSSFNSWETTDECLIFIIEPSFLDRIAAQTESLNPDKIELKPIILGHDSQIENLASLFLQEMQSGGVGGKLYTESLSNLLAVHLLRNYCAFPAVFKEYKGGLAPYKLKQVINYINDNLDKRIGLEDLSKLLDLSTYYLCREFRNSVGVSPYRYILERRIDKAKELIKNTKLSLADISYESGFSSQSQMTQHFRKTIGVTPKVYRDRL